MSTVKGKPRYRDNTHIHLFQVETTGRLRYIFHVGTWKKNSYDRTDIIWKYSRLHIFGFLIFRPRVGLFLLTENNSQFYYLSYALCILRENDIFSCSPFKFLVFICNFTLHRFFMLNMKKSLPRVNAKFSHWTGKMGYLHPKSCEIKVMQCKIEKIIPVNSRQYR